MTHGRSISPPDRRQGQRLRLLVALLVMCLAVIPHVTLAASLMRMPMPAASAGHEASPHAAHTASAAAMAEPCHRPQTPAGSHPATGAPVCCIIGCGLIAEASAIALPSRAVFWSRLGLAAAEPFAGISTEPAKPPPRDHRARS